MVDEVTSPKFHRDRQGKIKKIIQVFFALVEEKGYQNVSTNQVAKKAGVSIGTIYRYFPEGKPAIIRAEFQDKTENFISFEDIRKIIETNDGEAIRRLIQKYFDSHKEHYSLHKAADIAQLENREIFALNQNNIKEYIHGIMQKIKMSHSTAHDIPVENVQLALSVAIDMIDHAIHQHLFYGALFPSDEELIAYLVSLFQMTLQLYLFD